MCVIGVNVASACLAFRSSGCALRVSNLLVGQEVDCGSGYLRMTYYVLSMKRGLEFQTPAPAQAAFSVAYFWSSHWTDGSFIWRNQSSSTSLSSALPTLSNPGFIPILNLCSLDCHGKPAEAYSRSISACLSAPPKLTSIS